MPALLFIDDRSRMLDLIGHMMKATRFHDWPLRMARNLETAEQYLAEAPVSMIFLDNYLPPHRSFHIPLQRLQAISSAPIVLMTASDLEDLGETELPEDFAGFLPKAELSTPRLESLISENLGEGTASKSE